MIHMIDRFMLEVQYYNPHGNNENNYHKICMIYIFALKIRFQKTLENNKKKFPRFK